MATNDFQVFAPGPSANVIDTATYTALAARLTGFQAGLAQSNQANKVLRQSSIIAAMIAQFIVDKAGVNAVDDGTIATLENNFIAALQSPTMGRIRLQANLNLYVSASGNDSTNTGLTSGSAFATLQKAWDTVMTRYDLNGYGVAINVAAGTYAGVACFGMPIGFKNGSYVNFIGNTASPTTVHVDAPNSACFNVSNNAIIGVFGFWLTAGTGSVVDYNSSGWGIVASGGAQVAINNLVLGNCYIAQLSAYQCGKIYTPVANAAIQISGGAQYCVGVSGPAFVSIVDAIFTCGVVTYSSGFVLANLGGAINFWGNTFSSGANISGPKYTMNGCGVINIAGATASTYLPGSTAGSAINGSFFT
jgi:hypothetical protein